MRKLILLILLLALTTTPAAAQDEALTLTPLGTFATGVFDEGAAEIVAYDPANQILFFINGGTSTIDLLDISDPANPTFAESLDISAYGADATSVDVYGDYIAVAVPAEEVTEPGSVVFFTTTGEYVADVQVGVLPDMVTFSADGTRVFTADEGQPAEDYSADPEGSVSIIDVSGGVANVTQDNVSTVTFGEWIDANGLDEAIRVYGPGSTPAQDLEPEYVAVSPDGATVFAILQENNALAVIDVASATVSAIAPLGYKDHSVEGNGFDGNNDDGAIDIHPWPVLGMYQPDGLAAYEVDGAVYLVTANEGDTRDYETYSEESDLADLTLDAEVFPNAAELQSEAQLGNLTVTSATGDADGDGDYEAIYVPGARSFTIWAADGSLVWDSGDQFEQIIAETDPDNFNSNNDENGTFDNRSDNKGPEPEGLTLAELDGRTYAFIGLERQSAIVVYDISDPTAPTFVTYASNRDFAGDAEAGTAGDLGPEGLTFIAAEESPNGSPLLVVANEVSGTVSVWEIAAS